MTELENLQKIQKMLMVSNVVLAGLLVGALMGLVFISYKAFQYRDVALYGRSTLLECLNELKTLNSRNK